MQSYKELDVYQIAFDLAYDIHLLSMKLPRHELYEIGSQIRRSAHSVQANIVEGYGRRRYKQDFIRFLITAHASCLETISHLKMLIKLYPKIKFGSLLNTYEALGGKLYNFISYVEKHWKS